MQISSSSTTQTTSQRENPNASEVQKELDERGVDFAALLVVLKEMRENVEQGRPADWSKEEANHQAAVNEYLKNGEQPDEAEENANSQQGMNRIRSTLASIGFEPADIDAYLAAMKMPETLGQSDGDGSRRLDQQEQELEQQKQTQQLESRLTDTQQASASMLSGTPAQTDTARAGQPGSGDSLLDQLLTPVPELPQNQTTLDSLKDETLKMRALLG